MVKFALDWHRKDIAVAALYAAVRWGVLFKGLTRAVILVRIKPLWVNHLEDYAVSLPLRKIVRRSTRPRPR